MRPRVGVIVLAAGGSTRLGQPKQLLVWQGETLLRRATKTATSFSGNVVVVLGAQAERMGQELADLPVTVALNPDWESGGMGSSIRFGIATLTDTFPDIDAALIILCDQPLLTVDTLQTVVDTYKSPDTRAVVCRYDAASLGPPCLFDRSLFTQLLALRDRQGAKKVFHTLSPTELREAPFPDGIRDVDTPEEWAAFSPKAPLPASETS